MKKYTKVLAGVIAVSALSLAACSPQNENDSTAPKTEQESAAAATTDASASDSADQAIAFENGFVKAKPAADAEGGRDMTGIFGTIVNNSDEPIQVTGFSVEVVGNETQPEVTELHEVVDGQMQMKEGGYEIPAGESHELAPGADHMMIMDYAEAIMPGITVNLIIETADGGSVEVNDIPVREVGSGDESYGEDGQLQGHGDMGADMSESMSHDGHDHDGHDHGDHDGHDH